MDPKEMRERAGKANKRAMAILNRAKEANRGLTDDEKRDVNEFKAEMKDWIARAEKAEAEEANGGGNGGGLNLGMQPNANGNDSLPGNGQPGSALFRDVETGDTIRALSASDRLCTERPEDGIGALIYARLTGDHTGLRNAAQTGSESTGGGFLLSPQYGNMLIDLARSASVAMRAGVRTIPMSTSELRLARVESDPTAHWRAETVKVPSSEVGFGLMTLRAKMLGIIVPLSIELLSDAANARSAIEEVIRKTIGLAIDRAILRGSGAGSEPRGVLNTDGINSITGVGTPASYAKVSQAVGDVLSADYDGEVSSLAWVAHPRDGETFDNLADTTGQPMRPTPWVSQLRKFSTTSMPSTDGGGSNESSMLVGDFSQVLLGVRNDVVVEVLNSGTVTDSDGNEYNAASQFLRLLRCYVRVDVGVMRPNWLTALTGVTAA